MRLLMIGAPGAGKGTQAEQIATHFGLTHISSGDLFRQHVARKTAIGRVAKAYLQRGDLVPDAVVMDMLYKPVTKANQGQAMSWTAFRAPWSRPRRRTRWRKISGSPSRPRSTSRYPPMTWWSGWSPGGRPPAEPTTPRK